MSFPYRQNNAQVVIELGWLAVPRRRTTNPAAKFTLHFPNIQARNMPNGTRRQRDLLKERTKHGFIPRIFLQTRGLYDACDFKISAHLCAQPYQAGPKGIVIVKEINGLFYWVPNHWVAFGFAAGKAGSRRRHMCANPTRRIFATRNM